MKTICFDVENDEAEWAMRWLSEQKLFDNVRFENDKQTRKEESKEVPKLPSMSPGKGKTPIEEFWKSYEQRQSELMREAGKGLNTILRIQAK